MKELNKELQKLIKAEDPDWDTMEYFIRQSSITEYQKGYVFGKISCWNENGISTRDCAERVIYTLQHL